LDVIVLLSAEAAHQLQSKATPTPIADQINKTARDLNIYLRPLHPGVQDAELSRYFVVEANTSEEGERIALKLRELPAVEAAYIKPDTEIP
jgi:hypothetical protein